MNNFYQKSFWVAAALLFAFMLFFSYRYETNPYLWFDEAGQFWISKGLNHDSSPCSSNGSIVDVVYNNRDYNLDPGGYSIILHYWSMVSTNYLWLRTLSFLFFLSSVITVVWLFYKWLSNKNIAIIMGFIPFIISMFYHEAFEIRAYSMEILGTILCIASLENIQSAYSRTKLIIWSCVFSIFLSSRYSIVIVTFFTSTYLLYIIYQKENTWIERLKTSALFSLPMLVSLCLIYFLAMRYQNPKIATLSYLPYICNKPKLLVHNVSLVHFFYLGLIIWLYIKMINTTIGEKYKGLVYITVTTNIMFIILSALGFHPWSPDTTRCISMIVLVVLSFSAICGELINVANKRWPDVVFIFLLLIGMRFVIQYKCDYKESKRRDDAYTEFCKIKDGLGPNTKIYVDRWESPCMRYQFEYGQLKGNNLYPQNFKFAKCRKHSFTSNGNKPRISLSDWYMTTQPNMNDLCDYNVLVCPELYGYRHHDFDKWQPVGEAEQVFIQK